jgi:nucleotide-binding universal stress UspA family protein
MTPRAGSKIVVGVDGSDSSLLALRWAVRQAEMTGAALHALTAWSYPEHPTPFGMVPELPLPEDPMAEARRMLHDVVEAAVGREPSVEVRAEVVHGSAAPTLVDAARDAELLVVGSRGLGAFTGMLLGSVSEHCVRYAACPVVVVRSTKTLHG